MPEPLNGIPGDPIGYLCLMSIFYLCHKLEARELKLETTSIMDCRCAKTARVGTVLSELLSTIT